MLDKELFHVCDWSKKGVKQVKARTWAPYGPSPVNQVFDVQNRRHRDDDDDRSGSR